MGTPTRHMAESHCDTLWANATSPYPSTDNTRVTYGTVITLTSMLDAVSNVFSTALNFTEMSLLWLVCYHIFLLLGMILFVIALLLRS